MKQSPGPRALVVDYTPQIVQLVRSVLHTTHGIDHIESTGRGDVAADLLRANDYDCRVDGGAVRDGCDARAEDPAADAGVRGGGGRMRCGGGRRSRRERRERNSRRR